MPFGDALTELVRMVERTGIWPQHVAEGFTSLKASRHWCPKEKEKETP